MGERITRRMFLGSIATAGGLVLLDACGAAPVQTPAASATTLAATPTVAPTRVAVKGAWVALTSNQMVWPVAKEAGYFDKYGVDMDLSYISGSSSAVPALLAGNVGVSSFAGSAVVTAQAGGADIVMVAGFLNWAIFRVVAQPTYGSITELKGKTIAVTRIGNADYFAWQSIAAKQGWSASDLNFVNGADVNGQVTLLSSKKVDAIAVSPPNNILAVQAGGKEIFDTATLKEPEQNVGMATTRSYLTQNRGAVVGVVKASIEAMARWRKDPAFVKSVIGKYLNTTDQQFIDVGYSAYTDLWPQAPYPTLPGLQRVIDQVATQNAKAKDLKPEQLVDNSVVKEIEDSGFIKQIYAQ